MATKKLYELTPEHRAELEPWAEAWIDNALNCEPMDAADRAATIVAIDGMYEAAGLEAPLNIVFVPSPLVLAFAGCFAAGIWYLRDHEAATRAATEAAMRAATQAAMRAATEAATQATQDATRAATGDATRDVTQAATRDATEAATRAATWDATQAATEDATQAATEAATWDATWAVTQAATGAATEAATRAATEAATQAATEDATEDATEAATWDATQAATRDATQAATRDATEDATEAATRAATEAATQDATWAATQDATGDATGDATEDATGAIVRFLLSCCSGWSRMWNGGNQWSGYVAYLGFFCHVAKLDLPVYEKWQHYEAAAIHGGPRVVHPKFCMVSDRPLFIHRDEENRPHCETGPFCQWRDGWALYYIHGVRVTRQIVEFPETLTVERIREEENAEVRRVMIDRFTPERYLLESDAALIHEEHEPAFPGLMHAQLWQTERPGDAPLVMVKCRNSTPEAERGGDGELVYKTYWLRVDHEIRPLLADDGYGRPQKATCLNALASTWGLRGEEYMPLVES